MTASRIVFVAGLSGAGKTQTLKALEDFGFYCVEHLPATLAGATIRTLDEASVPNIALSLDTTGGPELGDAVEVMTSYANRRRTPIVYVDARDEVIIRRFSEARRRHPLGERGSLREALAAERMALTPIRERATVVIDTSELTLGALKERLSAAFFPKQRVALAVTVVPFGFKYGLPLDADLVFDVRFLQNPNYVDELRPLTGEDIRVASFIEADDALEPFVERLFALLDFLLPRYIIEGKAQLTIAVGCTGGRHRSVYVARRIADHWSSDERISLIVEPRDTVR